MSNEKQAASGPDYKPTVFLPRTDFPMRAGLPTQEPKHLARWAEMGLYTKLRDAGKGREKFILHDGPPYANGHLHIGHALNKILKDVIVRSQQMMGKDAHYVPGWDCHGLPIEWKIEEEYRKKGKDKDAVPVVEFRRQCREFAARWLDVQREEFKRLGIEGDWDRPYTTMAYPAEARIVRELHKFVMNGGLYRGAKPVMWSVVEKTALAEAEIEYHDHTSTTIWVRFPVVKTACAALQGAGVVIWTTTPWTMPGNRGVAYGADIDYVVIEVTEVADGGRVKVGDRIAAADVLVADLCAKAGIAAHSVVAQCKGADFAGTILHHPWHGQGYDFDVPMMAGDFVTVDQGTGFVHMAPSHGEDDYYLCVANGIAVPDTVADDGTYLPHVPLFAGQHVYKVAPNVVAALEAAGALMASGSLVHSYPHSWRSKAPLIYRTTPQWFISMDTNDLRAKALKAIDDTRWVPSQGRNRIHSMVESRPDWCVSRQRAWGVPVAVFYHKATGEVLRDQAVCDRIFAAFEVDGADAWYLRPASEFLGDAYNADDYVQVFDILDVWFDSGSTHSFVLEDGPWGLHAPASLYLEGSDQHRGWFHSSLLESCGTRGRAPYEAVLTHGFTLDEQGRKMSKSLGNVVAPQDVVNEYGADILRLWVVSTDYTNDQRIGKEILKQTADMYRRLRNTLRFLLGALDGYDAEREAVAVADMPELERWVLHRLSQLDRLVRQCCHDFDFHTLFAELHTFCAVDLSAFYFDIRKDTLYCAHPDDTDRKATRVVMAALYDCLVKWMAPFICFTTEEAWLSRSPAADSVHLELFPTIPADWTDDALARKWQTIADVRRVVTGALEKARAEKKIGASLQASPRLYAPQSVLEVIAGPDMADICITSGLALVAEDVPEGAFTLSDVASVGVVVDLAEGEKCQRCWKILPDVGTHTHEGVCGRCDDAVTRMGGLA
ncbi:isoleucine--tRNA ligase [Insolitispirillum peregrinum]|uniref:isoleucine--tRNA ligase n=1 Tax=Insolitispirillum peregrinum TaxID=80876 RepID=UPI00360A3B0B